MKFFKNTKLLLTAIFILGVFLRFFMLGANPPSLNWDEASTAYNAYSILQTGKDEYGNFMPLSIRSFDDYKPPLYTYLAVPSVAVFGLTDFAVRFPSAILGALTVLVIYFLTREILSKNKNISQKSANFISLTASFLFAISPWSLQFSRAAYEGNVGLFFLTLGALLLFKTLEKNKFLVFSLIAFALSMYSYHSFRLIVPLFILGFGLLYFKEFWKIKKAVIFSGILFIILIIPIYSSFLASPSEQGTGARLSMVSVFGDSPELQKSIKRLEYDRTEGKVLGYIFENRRFVYVLAAVKGYLDHYNPDFLFLHGDGGRQHHAVDFGMLYLFTLPFILLGVYFLCRNFSKRIGVLFLLMALAPLASAITTGTPHPVRAIIMAPVFDIWAAAGIVFFFQKVSSSRYQVAGIKLKYIIFSILFLVFSINLLYYFHQYYVHTPREYGDFWQYGHKEALEYAKEHEEKYDEIIMTYHYDQPYIFYLYYNKVEPSWYQDNWNFTGDGVMPRFERRIGKYTFKDINFGEESKKENVLLIGTPDEIPQDMEVLKTIYFLDGTPAFKIVES